MFLGNPEYGCELQPLDFAAFARACGATGFTVEDLGQGSRARVIPITDRFELAGQLKSVADHIDELRPVGRLMAP